MDAILIFNYQQFNKISVDLKFRKKSPEYIFKKIWILECKKYDFPENNGNVGKQNIWKCSGFAVDKF